MNYFQGRDTSISKIQLMMLDTIFSEIVRIVSFVVEPHNCSNAKFLEDRNVIIGSKSTIPVFVDWLVGRRAEGNEFLGEDPVEISVLYLFVVLILGQVECLIVEPTQLNSVL